MTSFVRLCLVLWFTGILLQKERAMKQPDNMCRIRNAIVNSMGKRVKIRTNKGRNRIDITEGVISATYPCVFLIQLDAEAEESAKTMSFSYTDVLTREVELVLV